MWFDGCLVDRGVRIFHPHFKMPPVKRWATCYLLRPAKCGIYTHITARLFCPLGSKNLICTWLDKITDNVTDQFNHTWKISTITLHHVRQRKQPIYDWLNVIQSGVKLLYGLKMSKFRFLSLISYMVSTFRLTFHSARYSLLICGKYRLWGSIIEMWKSHFKIIYPSHSWVLFALSWHLHIYYTTNNKAMPSEETAQNNIVSEKSASTTKGWGADGEKQAIDSLICSHVIYLFEPLSRSLSLM